MTARALTPPATGDNALLPVDFLPIATYVLLAMLRRLLACLALLTGLAAAGAPAQAEVVALASRVEASATDAVAAQGPARSAISQPSSRRGFARIEIAAPDGEADCQAPTVRLLSDRARE